MSNCSDLVAAAKAVIEYATAKGLARTGEGYNRLQTLTDEVTIYERAQTEVAAKAELALSR